MSKASYLTDLYSLKLDDNPDSTEIWIQAMPLGSYEHPQYGTIDITQSKVNQFVDNIKNNVRMQQLDIDYDHKAYGGDAAGWVKDAADRGAEGLWLLVDFTKKAFQSIKDKAYRYFSAEYDDEWANPKTGVVHKNVIFGGSLTNRPFLKDIMPINLSEVFANVPDAPTNPNEGGSNMTPEQVKSLGIKLGLGESATEAQVLEALEKFTFAPPVPIPAVIPAPVPVPPVVVPTAPAPITDPAVLAAMEEAKKLGDNNPVVATLLQLYQAQAQLVENQGAKLTEFSNKLREETVTKTVKELCDRASAKGYAIPVPMRDSLTATLMQLNDAATSKVILDGFNQMVDSQIVALGERGYLRNKVNDDGKTSSDEFTEEVKKLQEERDASRGVMMSLEDKNKQLQGTSAVSQGTFVSDLFTPGQLTGHQSRRAAKKRRLIHKPKGSNWHLQDEMGLTDDTVKYDRIIVRFFIISARGTNP